MPYKDRTKRLEYFKVYNKTWHLINREKHNMKIKTNQLFYKEMLFDILGHQCVKCGFSDKRALQFDHINGGGNKDHKKYGGSLCRYYAKRPLTAIKTLQVLCANCNFIKRTENKECRPNKKALIVR